MKPLSEARAHLYNALDWMRVGRPEAARERVQEAVYILEDHDHVLANAPKPEAIVTASEATLDDEAQPREPDLNPERRWCYTCRWSKGGLGDGCAEPEFVATRDQNCHAKTHEKWAPKPAPKPEVRSCEGCRWDEDTKAVECFECSRFGRSDYWTPAASGEET